MNFLNWFLEKLPFFLEKILIDKIFQISYKNISKYQKNADTDKVMEIFGATSLQGIFYVRNHFPRNLHARNFQARNFFCKEFFFWGIFFPSVMNPIVVSNLMYFPKLVLESKLVNLASRYCYFLIAKPAKLPLLEKIEKNWI